MNEPQVRRLRSADYGGAEPLLQRLQAGNEHAVTDGGVPVHIRCGSGTGAVTSGTAGGPGLSRRSSPSAINGKISTDSRPAQTSAAAVTELSLPSATPICVAVTMNGSDVACSSLRARVGLVPLV